MNKIKRLQHVLLLSAGSILALSIQSCSGPQQQENKAGKFEITDSLLNKLLIDTVNESSTATHLSLTGKVTPDEDRVVKIYPMVSGIIQDVHVHTGDYVKKGQVLASMKSAEIAGMAKEKISSEAELQKALKNLQVTEDLFKSGMASGRDVELAKTEYQVALAENRRSEALVKLNPSKGDLNYLVKSPIAGFVVEKSVTNNMQLRSDNAGNIFTIGDLSRVWVLANIYESDISRVNLNDDVEITALAYPGNIFRGKIDRIDNMLDQENKVIRARVKVDNPQSLLKPEMFANVSIKGKSSFEFPVINSRCLIFDNDRNYVLVLGKDNKVKIQPVVVDRKFEDKAYIKSGISTGDRLIASRQVFLYESLKN